MLRTRTPLTGLRFSAREQKALSYLRCSRLNSQRYMRVIIKLSGGNWPSWIRYIWDDSFSVGVREFDKQHKELITIINQLTEISNISVDSETISGVLTEMTEYANYHFKTEEKYLIDYDYPDYSIHKKQRGEFKEKTAEFCIDTINCKKSIPTEMLSYLRAWLINHILKSDMQYKSRLNEQGLK